VLLEKHPEIRALYGYDPKTAWITIGVFAAQLALAAAISRAGSWAALLLTAYFVGAILNHWLAMTIHETSHHLALRTVAQNRWLALFANLPCIVPMSMSFHRYHLAHHVYLGVPGKDTDLPLQIEVSAIANSRVKKFVWLLVYVLVYTARGAVFVEKPNRWEVLNLLIQVAFAALLWQWLGGLAVAYLAISTFFGMSLHPVAAHFIHEHYVFSPGQETYSYYGPLNYVAFNVGYHNEHHDFMQVPGSRLPELKRIARETYDPLVSHRSWTGVLWEFVVDRSVGVGSRIVRTADDFERGRRELRALRLARQDA
jgi:sphingolipid 4-desaturase/C4-monooxygenase